MKEREFSTLMSKAKAQVKDILQERGKDYGSFSDVSSFVNEFYITNIKSVVDRITELNNDEYNRAMVALFMIGIKLARLENNPEMPPETTKKRHLIKEGVINHIKCYLEFE